MLKLGGGGGGRGAKKNKRKKTETKLTGTSIGACKKYIINWPVWGFFAACTRTASFPTYLAPVVCQPRGAPSARANRASRAVGIETLRFKLLFKLLTLSCCRFVAGGSMSLFAKNERVGS